MGLEPNHGASKLKLMSYAFGAIELESIVLSPNIFIMMHPDFNLMSYPFGAMKLESIVLPLTKTEIQHDSPFESFKTIKIIFKLMLLKFYTFFY